MTDTGTNGLARGASLAEGTPMKKLIASILSFAFVALAAPINLIAAGRAMTQPVGIISGIASVDGKPLANVTVRLRNVDSGELVGNQTANAAGEFSFTGLGQGSFIVETVAANGTILGTSMATTLTAGAMAVAGVAVATSGSALAAAGGIGAVVAGGGAGIGISTTAAVLAGTAGLIGAIAIVVTQNNASPSQ